MEFVKMEGLGNDFIVVEGSIEPDPADIARWCRRRYGVGADGVLAVTPQGPRRVRMRYWNADGAPAEMCGNGLRCVARLAHDRAWVTDRRFVVETAVGDLPVVVGEDAVRAFLGTPTGYRTGELRVAERTVHPVGMGNPHAVLFVEDPAVEDVVGLGERIGTDPIFPDGTNVEFTAVLAPDRLRLRVWERGVGETLACGTGAAAAAFAAFTAGDVAERVTVELPGGELVVELDDEGAWIEGPARTVFVGSVS